MNRVHAVWILGIIAAVICTLGVSSTLNASRTLTAQIEQVSEEIKNGDISQAYASSRRAGQQWEECHRILCIFLGHEELDAVSRKISLLPAMLAQGETAQALIQCAELSRSLEQIRTSEIPRIENIL